MNFTIDFCGLKGILRFSQIIFLKSSNHQIGLLTVATQNQQVTPQAQLITATTQPVAQTIVSNNGNSHLGNQNGHIFRRKRFEI